MEAKADIAGSPVLGTWYFVCGGYDGANLWVSVNDGARNTIPFSGGIFDGSNNLYLGSSYNSNYLNGAMDETFLYKRSLAENEIGWLYNNGSGHSYARSHFRAEFKCIHHRNHV